MLTLPRDDTFVIPYSFPEEQKMQTRKHKALLS